MTGTESDVARPVPDVVGAAPSVPATPRAPVGARIVGWLARIAVAVSVGAAVLVTVVPWWLEHNDVRLAFVTSGSMTPALPVGGTIAYTRPADRAALHPGDVITFRTLATGTVVTHRVLDVIRNENLAGVHYQTKGDANRTPDPDLVPADNVIGLVSGPLPWWQQWAVAGQTPRGRLLVFGSLFLLVAVGEILDLVRGARRRGEAPAPGYADPGDGPDG